ncbi:M4 family metallopeptidase [Streptomyces sp. LN699]|uniref:M4 family metallopeptidase n=1 Tax=Streptomyces sp. LN699 TaxID=3112981 RepID=UPI00371FA6C0
MTGAHHVRAPRTPSTYPVRPTRVPALTRYLVPNSNFSGARAATLRAAADLYGANSTPAKTVAAAWPAVGVDGSDPVPPAPRAPSSRWVNNRSNTVGSEVLAGCGHLIRSVSGSSSPPRSCRRG